ncbi:MAG: winged helix-turn-helix transcriptional regulator [Theionarchaea archaeon]|nr:winged helix-turn-helix transcriptional regulator [Theionarchaea archaeon]
MIKILINEKTQRIFWFLWKNRKEPYTIREIARLSGVSYGSTWSVLKEFEELGLVFGIEKRKAYLYVLNFEHPLCFHVWSLLNALNREKIKIDSLLKEKIERIEEGFAVQYSSNGSVETILCTEKKVDFKFVDPENLKEILHQKKELFGVLWDEGVVLKGEKKFYTFMWELAEKRVIGVGV